MPITPEDRARENIDELLTAAGWLVQEWLGHSDMESTMRYLKPSRSQQVREKVNAIFA